MNVIDFQPMGTQFTIRLMLMETTCIIKWGDLFKNSSHKLQQVRGDCYLWFEFKIWRNLGIISPRGEVCGIMLVYHGI